VSGREGDAAAPPKRVVDSLRSVGRVVVTPVRELAGLWRRSIQARVVIGTVVLSTVLTMLAGFILLRQVTNGLLDSKEQTSIAQARSGAVTAQAKLDGAEITDTFDVAPLLKGLVETLAPRDEARDDFSVVIIGPLTAADGDASATGGSLFSGDIVPDESIPSDLMTRVTDEPGAWYSYTRVVYDEGGSEPVPGIAVGNQLIIPGTGQVYGLFYVYPLTEQRQSLFVVRGALITTGALLVVLLGFVAWLVTRQVVTPVRLARRIAERLAAGRLEERMHVRGEDDIARLGISFNQMAGSLQRQIRQLEELSRVQHRFVADVSHELRTPLTTVRMAADVLHDSRIDFDPATARSAELLQAELDRFEGLLTDLLEISRFDAGAAVLDLTDVDLRGVARRVVTANTALAERRGSTLSVRTSKEPAIAEVDVRRIERIVRNLVVNAIEYGVGGDVEVTVGASAQAVALTVRDHGIGLKPGEELLVFNRFWRADPARARTRGGTGLGLSIAVEDTALHSGTLDAWGEPGVGSVFRLTLPRRAGDRPGRSPLPLIPPERQPQPVGAPYARYPHDHRRGGL
jgi:two-component system, OmpR family, sensor histidine kinase MtrB